MTPQELKYSKIGVGVLIAGVIAYFVFKKDDNQGTGIDPTNNGNGGTNSGNYIFNPTKVANELYDAMKTANFGHKNIMVILQRINQSQFGQIVTAFGRKSYNDITGNQYGVFTLPLVGLQGWLKSELSEDDYRTLKYKYPNYL